MSAYDNNEKLTAVRIITLLYADYLLGYFTKHTDIAREALEYITEPDEALGVVTERNTIVRLKLMISWLIDRLEERVEIPQVDFMIQLEQVAQYEPWIKTAVCQIVELKPDEDKVYLQHTQTTLARELENTVTVAELVKKLKELYRKASYETSTINSREFSAKIVETFSPYMESRYVKVRW